MERPSRPLFYWLGVALCSVIISGFDGNQAALFFALRRCRRLAASSRPWHTPRRKPDRESPMQASVSKPKGDHPDQQDMTLHAIVRLGDAGRTRR